MPKFLLFLLLFSLHFTAKSQDHRFKFGQVPVHELQMKVYDKDTTANAVVLHEFGESYIDNSNDHNLLHLYHVRIKILNSKAFDQASITIPLSKYNGKNEKVNKIEAATYNLVNGQAEESKLEAKKVFTENKSKYLDLVKFTLPNLKEGSVIELQYTLESPFMRNFRTWEFQSDIPKIYSEYWAKIPGNYNYNISLRGILKLEKQDSEIIKDCYTPGGGYKADCSLNKYQMRHVPAFVEEDYMTAKSNYLSAIYFELAQLNYFDGRQEKFTKAWKDVDQELRTDSQFGAQLRKGKEVFKESLATQVAAEPDSLAKAQKVYDFVKGWYKWNDTYGKYSEFGIKKAFDSKTGNVGDINLSLVAALNMVGFNAEPVILSTRENGLPVDIFPVITDFNYVVAKVKIGGKNYFLDATDPFLSFGMLPVRCLNGKGRVISTKGPSYWLEIQAREKRKHLTLMNLSLQPDGSFTGQVSNNSSGYDALNDRKQIASFNNHDEYIENLDEKWNRIKIKKYEIKNLEALDKMLSQNFEVEIEGFDDLNKNRLFLSPFFLDKWEKNPFTSSDRFYPVDLGASIETQLILNLEYPANFELVNIPAPVLLALPNGGGKFIFNVQNTGNKVSLTSSILLSKASYSSEEYHYLKELFNRIVQSYKTNLVFNKKA